MSEERSPVPIWEFCRRLCVLQRDRERLQEEMYAENYRRAEVDADKLTPKDIDFTKPNPYYSVANWLSRRTGRSAEEVLVYIERAGNGGTWCEWVELLDDRRIADRRSATGRSGKPPAGERGSRKRRKGDRREGERRTSKQWRTVHHPDITEIARDIAKLDSNGGTKDLITKFLARYPDEAVAMELPKPDGAADPRSSALTSPAAGETIPNPSAPATLARIAHVWGGDMTAKKLTQMIGKTVRGKALSRQTYIVCLDDLPVAVRKKLTPTGDKSA